MITYQMKQKEHERLTEILDLIMYAENRQRLQKEHFVRFGDIWYNSMPKCKHDIEITDMAIRRLKNFYNNELNKLKPLS